MTHRRGFLVSLLGLIGLSQVKGKPSKEMYEDIPDLRSIFQQGGMVIDKCYQKVLIRNDLSEFTSLTVSCRSSGKISFENAKDIHKSLLHPSVAYHRGRIVNVRCYVLQGNYNFAAQFVLFRWEGELS